MSIRHAISDLKLSKRRKGIVVLTIPQTEDKVPSNSGCSDFLSDVEVIHNDSIEADITNKKEIYFNILFSKPNRYHGIINISRKAVFFYDD